MKLAPPLTQKDIDTPTEPRLLLLTVNNPRRSYWPLLFWVCYGAAITLLVLWLVR